MIRLHLGLKILYRPIWLSDIKMLMDSFLSPYSLSLVGALVPTHFFEQLYCSEKGTWFPAG